MKNIAFEKIMKSFGYEKVETHYGASFMHDCTFYKTDIGKVFVTDYNIANNTPLRDETAVAFSRKTGKHVRVTFEFMQEASHFFKEELEKLNTA